MLHKTQGIVLQQFKYSESARIIHMYTEHFGRVPYITYIRKSQKGNNQATLFQPLYILDLETEHKPKNNIQHIKEYKVAVHYSDIPYNIFKSSIALFISEFLYKTLKEEHPNPELFGFIKKSLEDFDKNNRNSSVFHIWFLVRMTYFLGIEPINNYSESTKYIDLREGHFIKNAKLSYDVENEITSRLWSVVLGALNFQEMVLECTKAQKDMLIDSIIRFYRIHFDSLKEIQSLEIFRTVFK